VKSDNEKAALDYKAKIMKTIIYPLNDYYKVEGQSRNIRYFTKYNPHVFGRVLDRNIDQATFAEIFTKLFETQYDYLLEIFEKDKDKMNSTDSVAIFVRLRNVSICFIVFNDVSEGYFSLMPLTVLGEHEYKKCNYEIEL